MNKLMFSARKVVPAPVRKLIRRVLHGEKFDEVAIVHRILTSDNYHNNYVPTMIDVGAHFGGTAEPFLRSGWKVFAFEPDKKNREILEGLEKRFSNLIIDKRAVSDENGVELPFYSSDVSSGISGLSSFHESHKKTDTVRTVTLERFCDDNKIKNIDFLKIDTEGFDLFVLKGLNWERVKPSVVVCEFEDRKTRPLGYEFKDLAEFLLSRGYRVAVSEWKPIVEYGQQHKWNKLFVYPGRLSEANSWGNLIAFQDPDCLRQFMDGVEKTARSKSF